MNIKYDQLCIRNAEKKDCEQLAKWWNDGKVMAHAGFPNGLGTTATEIKKQIVNDSDETRRRLMIVYKNTLIGEMSFYVYENAKIVLSMLIEELFHMGAQLIFLDTNLNNTRAQHVYEKLGFKRIAIHCDSWKNQLGELQSTVDYELTKGDFCNFKNR